MTQPDATVLTMQQEWAAEMLAAGTAATEVAQIIGVDRTTVWRWQRLSVFQEQMNELRRVAWRAAADRLRQNVLLAVDVLGSVLTDDKATTRDRIAAAREVIRAAGPLFGPENREVEQPPETPAASPIDDPDWRGVVMKTALRAVAMQDGDSPFLDAHTPGAAWAEAGLEAAFPGSLSTPTLDVR